MNAHELIVPIVAGVLGLLPVVVQLWADRAKRRSRRHRLESLATELALFEKWASLVNSVVDEGERPALLSFLTNELERVKTTFEEMHTEDDDEALAQAQRGLREVSLFRRAFLLYQPRGMSASIVHFLFYSLVLLVTLVVVVDLTTPLNKSNESEFGYLLIGLTIMFGIPALILQQIAVRMLPRLEVTSQ